MLLAAQNLKTLGVSTRHVSCHSPCKMPSGAAPAPQQQQPPPAAAAAATTSAAADDGQRYAIAIHGGAGVINTSDAVWLDAALAGLSSALAAGRDVLAGGCALDAVVAAVAVMEDGPHFNAGVGSVLTASGRHELEASVMSSDGACGAAALLTRVRNPIRLAQQVMQATPHIWLAGPEAEAFAQQQGLELVADNAHFTTPQRREQWERYRHEEALAPADEIVQKLCDTMARQQQQRQDGQTVGAVAVDMAGRLAAATSTGGRTNKWDGRIGDTPIIGAGTWADGACALSGTGVGEEFMRRAAAHDVAARLRYKGVSLAQAVHEVVWGDMAPGDGGFVGVDAAGNVVMDFNSAGMWRGAADSRGRWEVAVFPPAAADERAQ